MAQAKTKLPRFAAALSTIANTEAAVAEVCQSAMNQLQAVPDLALLFASAHHAAGFAEAAVQVS